MKITFIALFLIFNSFLMAQLNVDSLVFNHQKKLSSVHNHPCAELKMAKNPIVLVGKLCLYFYQKVISDQIGASCAHEPSCSEFCKQSIEKKGFIRGILLTGDRLQRCTPFNVMYMQNKRENIFGGKIYDPVP